MSYLQSFIFGITLAISIGPIAILILNQSINCGLKNGALCGLGAATADLSYAVTAFIAGSIVFPLLENQGKIIPFVSSFILIIFGIWMAYSTLKKKSVKNNGKYSLTCKWPFLTTYGLTIANPLTIIVFAGFAGLVSGGGNGNLFLHAFFIFIASLMIQLLIAITGSRLSRFLSKPSTLMYFNLASSAGIILFGVSKLIN